MDCLPLFVWLSTKPLKSGLVQVLLWQVTDVVMLDRSPAGDQQTSPSVGTSRRGSTPAFVSQSSVHSNECLTANSQGLSSLPQDMAADQPGTGLTTNVSMGSCQDATVAPTLQVCTTACPAPTLDSSAH